MQFIPSPKLYPFESRWLQSPAGRVHYIDEGSGPPILMCHGNPTWSFLYRHVIGQLRDRFRCIAIDYPGFGLSDRPADYGYTPSEHAGVVDELTAELGLRDMIVMGHDWGGPIGLAVACATPDRVSVWCSATPGSGPRTAAPEPLPTSCFDAPDAVGDPAQKPVRRADPPIGDQPRAIGRGDAPLPVPCNRARRLRVGVAELPKQIVEATSFLAGLEHDVPRKLSDKPVVITSPMRDRAFPAASVLPRMRETSPNARITELPDAKHCFVEDAPHEVATAIVEQFA